jgi:hypothetical protein
MGVDDANAHAQANDARAQVLEPQPDVLLYLEVPDELLNYYLSRSRASGMVYALAIKQLINRMYRDHDYVRRRKLQGKRTAYDYAVERDSQALAWLIAAGALYVPEPVKRHPIPPRPPKPTRRTPKSNKLARAAKAAKAAQAAQEQQAQDAPDDAAAGSPPTMPKRPSRDDRLTIAKVEALLEAAKALQAVHELGEPHEGRAPPADAAPHPDRPAQAEPPDG